MDEVQVQLKAALAHHQAGELDQAPLSISMYWIRMHVNGRPAIIWELCNYSAGTWIRVSAPFYR